MLYRRQFLGHMLWGGTGLFLSQSLPFCQTLSSDSPPPKSSLTVAQGGDEIVLPPRQDIRLVVLSDLNGAYGSVTYDPEVHQAIQLIGQWQPDLVLCGGDMVAGQSKKLSPAQIQAMWQGFDQAIAQPLISANIPFGFTLGNHDGSGYQASSGDYVFQRDRELARAYWIQRKETSGLAFVDDRHFPFYYSFQQSNIFYLVWDATTASLSSKQLSWVEESLSQAQDAALRVVIGHLPLYAVAVGRNKPGEILNDAEMLQDLLVRYGVDTYISGHHHAYYPGEKNDLKFLHAGALGGGPRLLIGSDLKPFKSLTVVDVNLKQQQTRYATLNLSTFQWVDSKTLPSQITGVNGTIYRQK